MSDEIHLRYSDNGGGSWSVPITQNLALTGEYDKVYQWTRLGMGRDRVFEVSWVSDRPLALSGAYVFPTVGRS